MGRLRVVLGDLVEDVGVVHVRGLSRRRVASHWSSGSKVPSAVMVVPPAENMPWSARTIQSGSSAASGACVASGVASAVGWAVGSAVAVGEAAGAPLAQPASSASVRTATSARASRFCIVFIANSSFFCFVFSVYRPRPSSQACTSSWLTREGKRCPSSQFACRRPVSARSSPLSPRPELEEVQKGITVLPVKSLVVDKVVHGPGGDAPPDRVADEHRVVLVPVVDRVLHKRHVAGVGVVVLIDHAAVFVAVQFRSSSV